MINQQQNNTSHTSITVKFLLLLCCFVCSTGIIKAQEYTAGAYVFSIKDFQNAKISFSKTELKKGLTEVTFKIDNIDSLSKELRIAWSVPMVSVAGCWTTNSDDARFVRMSSLAKSNLASHSPVISMFDYDSNNCFTFASSDAFHQTTLSVGVNEEEARLNCSINVILAKDEKSSGYKVSLLLDSRPVAYYESLKQVSNWWAAMPAYKPADVPVAAKLPVYSTWYSYHQNFNENDLLGECVQAKGMGYETIIVDDGWQTLKGIRGYGYTGDWNPERISNMAEFVKKVHHTGMKCLLWYSVPFMGYHARAYDRFKGKYLYQSDRISAGVLDPRYPQVRRFIVEKYLHDLKEWNLDGFKLDFIDSFTSSTESPPVVGSDADIISLYVAIDQLMVDIKRALTTAKPDVLIEFRQSYTGPAMRKYGNMFRAGDCPAGTITNRVRTTDLKLLAGATAVHSDMLIWNYHEPVNIAALQLLNVIFSVPQLSVKIKELLPSHLNMVKFYTRYWLTNKDVLINGDFRAFHPELNYPMLMSVKNKKAIVGLYADVLIPVNSDLPDIDIINAKISENVLLKTAIAATCKVEFFNCEGKKLSQSILKLKRGINHLSVPSSGLIKIHQILPKAKNRLLKENTLQR